MIRPEFSKYIGSRLLMTVSETPDGNQIVICSDIVQRKAYLFRMLTVTESNVVGYNTRLISHEVGSVTPENFFRLTDAIIRDVNDGAVV